MPADTLRSESTMQEVLCAFPGARRALMRKYHIGGCNSCGFSMEEPLGDVLQRHKVTDVEGVLVHLRDSERQESGLQIEPKEVAEAIRDGSPVKLIDVRSPEEQQVAMITSGIPGTQKLVQEMMSTWSKDAPIVTYCHHGIRSLEAASYFIGHGFTNVRSMKGGIDAWSVDIDATVPRY